MTAENKKMLLLAAMGIGAYFFLSKPGAPDAAVDDAYVDVDPTFSDPVSSPVQNTIDKHVDAAIIKTGNSNLDYLLRVDTDPNRKAVYKSMTAAELQTAYQYFYGYLMQGKKLYRLPGSTGIYADGGWNTGLYDAVQVIKAKYKIF